MWQLLAQTNMSRMDLGMMITALGVLSAAVGVLWKKTNDDQKVMKTKYEKDIEVINDKLTKCEEDREDLHKEQRRLWIEIGSLGGKVPDDKC